eukprot:20006-Heterococcus_DN1.PRE.3
MLHSTDSSTDTPESFSHLCCDVVYKTTGLGKAVEVTCGVRGADGLYERFEYSFGPAELGYEIDMDKPLEHISSVLRHGCILVASRCFAPSEPTDYRHITARIYWSAYMFVTTEDIAAKCLAWTASGSSGDARFDKQIALTLASADRAMQWVMSKLPTL